MEEEKKPLAEARFTLAGFLVFLIVGGLTVLIGLIWLIVFLANINNYTYPMSGIGMSLGIIMAGIIIILLGILARLQYIKVYDDEIVLYKVFSTYRLPIDEVSSVGRGWLGIIKIGTSSYWLGQWFIFMTGGKQVVSEAMRIIKQRNAK